MTEIKEEKPTRKIKYDQLRKELVVTTIIEEMQAPNGERSKRFGRNKNEAIISEEGLKIFVKDLNEQKVNYQRQYKELVERNKKFGEIEVDEAFLKQMESYERMKQKKQLTDAIINAEQMVSDLNKQLNEIKGAVGNHIKW